jgi:hypothetical protein
MSWTSFSAAGIAGGPRHNETKGESPMKKAMLSAIAFAALLSVSFAAQKPMSYTGQIMKNGGAFVLVDAATKVVYQLDNQKKPKDFAGDKVIVTGTLDTTTMTIHVKGIYTAPGVQNTAQWGVR